VAVQSKQVVRISAHGSVVFEVFMEYHDDDYQTINDDGDPDDFRIIRWYGTNHSVFPKTVVAKRGNGQAWMTFTECWWPCEV